MITQALKEYIEKYKLCAEYLFEDWEKFLDFLYLQKGSVSAILWWDHCKRAEQHHAIGRGGYIDPNDPAYMYAETQIYEDGFASKSLDEIKEYIRYIRSAYPGFDLIPSFYLDEP